MKLHSTQYSGALLIKVDSNRIDAAGAVHFKDQMREMTATCEGRVILDLEGVEFIDSSGLGAIVAAMKQMDANQNLELASLSPTVEKVFRLTRMDSIFSIHETAEVAMERTPEHD
jgi:anti-sigma B factor antagonist